jgi:adenylate cyclase, class 2
MQFEVEQKFPVASLDEVAAKLRALGAAVGKAIVQVDRYFAHPARDFAQTDEALRIRQVGQCNFLTYKGPKIDRVTKTRREIELPLSDGDAAATEWAGLLEELGFRPVAEVQKSRQCLEVTWDAAVVEVALDRVHGVGDYVELEVLADAATLDDAKSRVRSLAAALGLTQSERRSYLELLLDAQAERGSCP